MTVQEYNLLADLAKDKEFDLPTTMALVAAWEVTA